MIKLPIDAHLDQIIAGVKNNSSVILTASPGSGKTTRLPPALIKSKIFSENKKIVVLVPKRLAAVSACVRIAEEQNWQVGCEVGYQVRFEKEYDHQTQLLFMTEGVFLKKISDETFAESIGLVIFDEFHERTAFADLSLGLCFERQLLQGYPKIMVMSATLDTTKIKNFLGTDLALEIVAPPHPLKINYSHKGQRLVCDDLFYAQFSEAVKKAWQENKQDVLCFLPGLQEIRKASQILAKSFLDAQIQILHSSVSLHEQQEILKPQKERRIILSTNVAESSLTLPAVDAVVDSGLQKQSRIEPKIGFSKLELVRISLFSAQQRAGRAARTGPGQCYRLWHETDELSMSEQTVPEILKSNLISEVLILTKFNISQHKAFSWLEAPSEVSFTDAFKKLKAWGLIDPLGKITLLGKKIESCPLDIERSLLLIHLAKHGHSEQAIDFVTALETESLNELFRQKNISTVSDIDRLLENVQMTKKSQVLKSQLRRWIKSNDFMTAKQSSGSFENRLIQIYFKYFPEKIGQLKSNGTGLSSQGRGFQLLPGLHANQKEYVLLISGREINSAMTQIEFAVGFSKNDFLSLGSSELEMVKHHEVNFEKQVVYQIQQKRIGSFIISESSKMPLSQDQVSEIWPQVLNDYLSKFLEMNSTFQKFVIRQNFLRKFSDTLKIDSSVFKTYEELLYELKKNLTHLTMNLNDLIRLPLENVILNLFDGELLKAYKDLPENFKLPNGKLARIDYECERAPMISVKIQDIFGQKTNPTIVQGKLTLTIELLAPNQRPAQVTSQLVQFWQTSYQEIAKELKSRYPKHPWPTDPMNYVYSAPLKKS